MSEKVIVLHGYGIRKHLRTLAVFLENEYPAGGIV